jgi:DNA repair protein SbcD/Mre11
MRFIHASDLHLGRRPRGDQEFTATRYEDYFEAFERACDVAIERGAEAFLLAGDIFDRKDLNPTTLEKTQKLLEKLRAAEIEVIAIEGNHDKIYREESMESWLNYLERQGLLRIPGYEYLGDGKYEFTPFVYRGVNFFGAGYPGNYVDEVLSALAERLPEDCVNVALAHTGIIKNGVGSESLIAGVVNPATIDKFKGKVVYIAGGHLHSRSSYPSEEPFFFLPGSLEYWDLAEDPMRKGVTLFDTETRKHEFIPLAPRHKVTIKCDVESSSLEEFRAALADRAKEYEIPPNSIIMLQLDVRGEYCPPAEDCRETLAEYLPLRCEVKYLNRNAGATRRAGDYAPIEILERELIANWEDFGNGNAGKTHALLEAMKATRDNEATFFETVDLFLNSLIEGDADVNS